jgi:hypothetical protein
MRKNTEKKEDPQEKHQLSSSELVAGVRDQSLSLARCGAHWDRFGLYEGDIVICQPTKEINEDQLTVWDFSGKQGTRRHLGFAYENFGDISLSDNDG